LDLGHVAPSKIPFASQVMFVEKKDGSFYMCKDYWELNKKTLKNWYAIPLFDQLLDELKEYLHQLWIVLELLQKNSGYLIQWKDLKV
jgi:hypothetical protein